MRQLLSRFINEDSGQDMIEYALPCGLISMTGTFAWQNIGATINMAYGDWNTGVQELWLPEDPIAALPPTPGDQP